MVLWFFQERISGIGKNQTCYCAVGFPIAPQGGVKLLFTYSTLSDTFFKGNYWLAFMGIFVFLIIFSTAELVVSNEVVFKLFD